eukprot:363804-Chlamydomonas_euryale.AAC.7
MHVLHPHHARPVHALGSPRALSMRCMYDPCVLCTAPCPMRTLMRTPMRTPMRVWHLPGSPEHCRVYAASCPMQLEWSQPEKCVIPEQWALASLREAAATDPGW